MYYLELYTFFVKGLIKVCVHLNFNFLMWISTSLSIICRKGHPHLLQCITLVPLVNISYYIHVNLFLGSRHRFIHLYACFSINTTISQLLCLYLWDINLFTKFLLLLKQWVDYSTSSWSHFSKTFWFSMTNIIQTDVHEHHTHVYATALD